MSISVRALLIAATLTLSATSGAFASGKITILDAAPVAATDVPADAIIVRINKNKYQTPELKIKAGTTVVWINDEVMPHNVAFRAGMVDEKGVATPMLTRGQSASITFNEAGTYDYFCTPHPFMRAKVIVE